MIDGQYLLTNDFGNLPEVLAEWRAQHPRMGILALLPEAEKSKILLLQNACRAAATPLLGAVFPLLLTEAGFVEQGAWLLRFDTMPPSFLLPELDAADAPAAAERIFSATEDLLRQQAPDALPPTLFTIFDGMLPNIASIMTGVYRGLKRRVQYTGVNAGSESFQPMACLFDADTTTGSGVLALLIPNGTQAAVSHGYPVSRGHMRATSTVGNRVDRIDGRPAFEAYKEMILSEYGVALTHENFYDHAVHFPFGVVTAADILVRIPVEFGDDGSIICVGEVPANSMLRLLRAPTLEESDCVDTIADTLANKTAAGTKTPLVTFYCAGRRMHFGENAAREIEALKQRVGIDPVIGALSLGEIDTMPELGLPRFHNATLVCLR